MAAKIHVERMMHRSSIMVAGDSAASYALIKLIPAGEGGPPLRLNLALALDVSGSMHEFDGTNQKRIERVRRAALAALAKLRPDDRLAVVAFGHDARVLLPSTSLADRAAVEKVIHDIENADVDPGGTAMDQGLALLEPQDPAFTPLLVSYLTAATFRSSLHPLAAGRLRPVIEAAGDGRPPDDPGLLAHLVLRLAFAAEPTERIRALAGRATAEIGRASCRERVCQYV